MAERAFGLLDEVRLLEDLGLPERLVMGGMDYVDDGRVKDALAYGDAIAARVDGHRADYRVWVRPGPPFSSRCGCTSRGVCRHAAAVMIAFARDPGTFTVLDAPLPPADLAASLFAMAAGKDDPLAPLGLRAADPAAPARPPARAEEDLAERWRRARAEGRHAALRFLRRHLAGAAAADPTALATLRKAAEELAADPGVRLDAADAKELVARYVAGTGVADLDALLRRLLGAALPDRLAAFADAALSGAVWQARAALEVDGQDPVARGRAARAAALLLDRAARRGGPDAVAAVAETHRQVPGVAARAAEALVDVGRLAEAARAAQTAFVHAGGAEAPVLRALLERLGHEGVGGVYAFFAALWEADPSEDGLAFLLSAGTLEERSAFAASARDLLTVRHRWDLLAALRLSDGDARGAAAEALRDGPHASSAADCERLAVAVAGEDAMLAVRLLGSAFRRTADPTARRTTVRHARLLVDQNGLGSWQTVRVRYFPERPPGGAKS